MKTLTLSVVGLVVLGLVAAFCAVLLVSLARQGGPVTGPVAAPPEVIVVVASKPLPAMAIVTADSVTTAKLPMAEAPAGYFSGTEAVVGKPLAAPMVKSQPFTRNCFVAEGTGQDMAAKMPEGMRAVSLALADHNRLEGLLYPGAVVDVLASFESAPDGTGRSPVRVSTPLLQGVQVLAVGAQTVAATEDKSKPSAPAQRLVTLLVDPGQAKALQLASLQGSVTLVMRGPLDQKATEASPMAMADLVKFPSAPAAIPPVAAPPVAVASNTADTVPPPTKMGTRPAAEVGKPIPPPGWEITVIRGSAREKVTVDLPPPDK